MRLHGLLLALVVPVAASSVARADIVAVDGQIAYTGIHPLSADVDDGLCLIEFAHVHTVAPAAKVEVLYRQHDGTRVFVGDPVPYGYDGPKHTYYGHHPIPIEDDHEFCYLDGPHYHIQEPATDVSFQVHAGAYWYVGDLGPRYAKDRKRYARINAVYRPMVYARPVVFVEEPPVGYVGPFVDVEVAAPGVVVEAPAVHVDTPRAHAVVGAEVDVHVPVPSISVEWGLPGVYVESGHHHDHVVVEHHVHGHGKVKHRKHKKHKKSKRHRRRHLFR